MASKLLETAFLQALRRYEKGLCYLCRQPTADPDAYCHYACAVAYSDEKDRNIQAAWQAAEEAVRVGLAG